MEKDEIIEAFYKFKARNMSNERVYVGLHFTEVLIDLPPQRYTLYCTIYVQTNGGHKQFYHGGTVWNGEDTWNANSAIFRAFQSALKRRFVDECIYQKTLSANWRADYEAYRRGWCKHLWNIMSGGKNGNDHPDFF